MKLILKNVKIRVEFRPQNIYYPYIIHGIEGVKPNEEGGMTQKESYVSVVTVFLLPF